MPEESLIPDRVELVRSFWAWGARGDWDRILAYYAPDAVWDMSPLGLGTYGDAAAMRAVWEDWVSTYEELELDVEAADQGGDVTLAVIHQRARPTGSTGQVESEQSLVYVWRADMVSRVTLYPNVDEARAAAERLAESRG
jgi:ketosteroid isomerase-like protein